MKVQYIVNKAGASFNINVGDVEEVSEEKGKRLLNIRHAVIAKKDATINFVTPESVINNSKKNVRKAKAEKAAKKK